MRVSSGCSPLTGSGPMSSVAPARSSVCRAEPPTEMACDDLTACDVAPLPSGGGVFYFPEARMLRTFCPPNSIGGFRWTSIQRPLPIVTNVEFAYGTCRRRSLCDPGDKLPLRSATYPQVRRHIPDVALQNRS